MDAFIEQNSWILSKESPFVNPDPKCHLIESNLTGLCWLRTLDKHKIFPSFRIQINGHIQHWIAHNGVADIRGSQRRLQQQIFKVLSKHIPHDMNGRLMGIDGVIDYWKETPLDAQTAIEDLQNIKDSLSSLSLLSTCLGWLSKEGQEERRVFALSEIHSTIAPILVRLCKPSNFFQIPKPDSNKSVLSAPHTVVFWSFATARLLSAARRQDETLSLSWSATNGSEEPSLVLDLKCESLRPWIEGDVPEHPESLQLFYDWLVMLSYIKASIVFTPSGVQITIPMGDLTIPGPGKILCVGHHAESCPPSLNPLAFQFTGESIQEFVDAFSARIFAPTVVFLSQTLPPDMTLAIREIIESVDEAPIIMR